MLACVRYPCSRPTRDWEGSPRLGEDRAGHILPGPNSKDWVGVWKGRGESMAKGYAWDPDADSQRRGLVGWGFEG